MAAFASRGLMVIAICGVLACCAQTPAATQAGSLDSDSYISTLNVTAVNLSGQRLQQVPITFGQPFRTGDISRGNTIAAYLDGKVLPTQANIKARNPDGSVRHAILTVLLPTLPGRGSEMLALRPVPEVRSIHTQSLSLDDLLHTSFDAAITIDVHGQPWHLDARTLLQQAAHNGTCRPYGRDCDAWLSGPLVSAWIVGGPLLNAQGQPHPHLAVYFAVRAYGPTSVKRVRVDVIVENDWAYAPDPHNINYDAEITVGGQSVYRVSDLEHYRQARWHKVFWWGAPDPVYARLNSAYLQDSLAVPRYEPVTPPAGMLSGVRQDCDPMQWCDQTRYMANTGAQAAIGPLARWSAVYVIDPTYRAYRWMLANDDALGSYGIHFRDQLTGQPVSVEIHPCMTMYRQVEVKRCPVPPHADDSFPRCISQCKTPLYQDESHHPEPAYVAYLVTGDWYYLEELKFWADWVIFHQNPEYRDYTEGLISDTQVRGQAWALRTLGYAAYILPDADPFKHYFNNVVAYNISWYNKNYTDNPSANKLHVVVNGYALPYPNHGNPNTGTATWQQSFFIWSVGNLKDLGFEGAGKLLNWFAVFPVNLMTSPDFCWVLASAYQLQVRATRKSPFYGSLKDVYDNTFPQLKGVRCNSAEMASLLSRPRGYRYFPDVMVGYPQSPTGYPASFQIGLAEAADSDVPGARQAWAVFANRKIKPNYTHAPQFAIVPRQDSN